ncbi:MAG: SLC13 family permease, partial [Polyangia bacterium]
MLLLAIIVVSLALMLARPLDVPEGYWVAGGALLLVALGLVPWRSAVHAVGDGVDVYLFLVGMMLLSELARVHGLFDWLASWAMAHARGSSTRLFALLYAVGVLVTVFLSNDA